MTTPTLTWRELRAAYPDHEIQILQRLGIDQSGRALVCDGKVGPRTEGATFLNPAAVITPVAKVALAELMRGAGESLGNNRGPDISKYMRDDSPTAQQGPWCAGFATWCLREVYPTAPYSQSARRSVSQLRHKVIQRLVRADDLIAWERVVDGKVSAVHGHVEIVALVVGDVVWTIGGNVDVRPGAAGDGVAARSYSLAAGLVNRSGNACVGIGRHTQLPPQMIAAPLALTLAQASEALAIPVVNLTATQAVMSLAGLGAALAVLVEVIKQLLPAHVKAGHLWAKVLPVLAPLLGALLAPLLAAGWSVEGVPLSLGAHALAGLVAGSMSGGLYSVVAQSLMGRDRRLGAGGTSAE